MTRLWWKKIWIMHAVFGLKQLGLTVELKGGTSLSKGFAVIHPFSEDIDIRIEAFDGLKVDTNPNHGKPQQVESRRVFYEKLLDKIRISGITAVEECHGIPSRRGSHRTCARAVAERIARIRNFLRQSWRNSTNH